MTDDTTNNIDDQVSKKLSVGKQFRVNGFTPHHPVAMFNSLSGCVLEVVESSRVPAWAGGGGLWVDVGKLTGATWGNVTGLGHTKTAASREEQWHLELIRIMDVNGDGNVDPRELLDFLRDNEDLQDDECIQRVLKEEEEEETRGGADMSIRTSTKKMLNELKPSMPKILAALLQHKSGQMKDTVKKDTEGSTEFTKHMQLKEGWKDPDGIQVRARQGVPAMECLVANDPTGLAAKLGAALMLGVTSQLKAVGYEEGTNLRGYGYDWRTPCTRLEERDGYFSKTMTDMEDLVKTNNGNKIVVVTHSLGGVHASYFFHWIVHSASGKKRGGKQWIQDHIHSFCPIAAPSLGTPYGSASYLSGDEGQGLAPMVFSFPDRHLVVRSWGMFGMIFPSGRHLQLQPTQSVHWVRREGLLNVHILSAEMKTTNDDKKPKAMPFYIKLGFKSPVNGDVHTLKSSTLQILTAAAVDQRFQFAWTTTPDQIETAQLTVSFMKDIVGPIDKELAKGTFDLGTDNVEVVEGVDKGTTLEGLTVNDFKTYEFKLDTNGGHGEMTVSARLEFCPHNDSQLNNDFSRPNDPGAWRCGGAADICTTPEKQARLLADLGDELGTEWHPQVKPGLSKDHADATYAPMTIDQMMVYDAMEDEYKWWKESYADNDIWRTYSTEPPEGITRVRPIYGLNVPTLVGNVYRRQTKRFERYEPTTTMKLDKHCEVKHPGYKINNGVVEEVPHVTPQADDPTVADNMTFQTKASGDGTVAYWSLKWPITWRASGVDVELTEVEGADHRNILDAPACPMAVLSECCSHPVAYLEVIVDGLVISNLQDECMGGCMSSFACITTMGVINDYVFLQLSWRGEDFTTETISDDGCTPDRTKQLWKRNRFVFGVTQQDLEDEDRTLDVSVMKPRQANVASGSLREGTQVVKTPMKNLLNDDDDEANKSLTTFSEDGLIILKWACRSISPDSRGMPSFE